jgi:two-component system sensor histidine kinase EvgS
VKPGKYIKLSFHDSGIGIPKKIQDNIFNPFFTTKEIGNNSGLGLSVVAGIVGENKGFIRVSSKPNNGTRFDIYFPQVNTKLTEQSSGHKEKSSSTGNETILIVEDEDILCNMLYKIFLMNGYTVLTAANLKESLKVFKTHDSPIRLLITDIVLPEIKECDLKKRISSLFPEVKVICMSGYPEDEIAPYISVDENNDYLQKPFTISELLFKVRRLLDNNEKKY